MEKNRLYRESFQRLSSPVTCTCKIKDSREKHRDFDYNQLRLWEGSYATSDLETKCLITKSSEDNKIDFSSYSIMKNIRQKSIITLENYYQQSGQARLVLSWVDGSLTAWLKGGCSKCFESAINVRGSCPSRTFRRMIIETCRAMKHLFEQNIYPTAVNEEDLYLCNEHVKGYGPSIKILINKADRLLKEGDKIHREQKLWKDVQNIFEGICKKASVQLSGPSKRFISHIGDGNVDMLEGFPDSWSCNKKGTYLFSIISANSNEVRLALQNLNFGWPKGTSGGIHQVLRTVIDHEKGHGKTYDVEDGYDYLRLCRNIVKHWKPISKSVSYLQKCCSNAEDFLRMMERWTPNLWCLLYEHIGWPQVK